MQYMAALRTQFPDFVEDLDDDFWRGRISLETACIARRVQQHIDNSDYEAVRRSFDFFRNVWTQVDSSVKMTIADSFVENLDFHDKPLIARSWAFPLMAPVFQEIAHELGGSP